MTESVKAVSSPDELAHDEIVEEEKSVSEEESSESSAQEDRESSRMGSSEEEAITEGSSPKKKHANVKIEMSSELKGTIRNIERSLAIVSKRMKKIANRASKGELTSRIR